MNAFQEIPAYWLNFLLHTTLLSAFAWALCVLVRDPGRRAFAALVSVAAMVILPWFTAMKPLAPAGKMASSDRFQRVEETSRWNGWTIRIHNPSETAREPDVIREAAAPVVVAESLDRKVIVGGVWLVGSLLGLGWLVVKWFRYARWAASLRKPAEDERSVLESLSPADIGRFLVSGSAAGPCAIGFFRLRMVVPESMFQESETKLAWVVRHEAEHLRGGDPRCALMLSLARCAAWWNPIVHLLAARWAEDRERVCDARALSVPDEGKSYGAFLLDLTEMKSCPAGVPMAMSGGARRMSKRLRALVRGDRVAPGSTTFRVSALVSILAGAALIATGEVRTATDGATDELLPDAEAFVGPKMIHRATVETADTGEAAKTTPQVKVTAMFVLSKAPVPEVGTTMPDREYQLMMRRLAMQAGTDLVTPPSQLVPDGKTATFAAVYTRPEDRSFEDVRTVPFVGISLISSPRLEGEKVTLSVDCQMNFEPDKMVIGGSAGNPNGLWPLPAPGFDWKTIRSATVKAKKSLSPGDYLVLPLKGLPEGTHIIGIFSVEIADSGALPEPYSKISGDSPRIPTPPRENTDARIVGEDGVARVPALTKISTKLILRDKPIPEIGKTLSDKEMFQLMVNYSKDEGVKLLTTPSVMAKTGQNSRIEIIREVPADLSGGTGDFIGLSQETLGEISGNQLNLTIDSILNYGSGALDQIFVSDFLSKLPEGVDWTKIRSARAKATVSLSSGEIHVIGFEGTEEGKHLAAFVEVRAIDGTGRPIKSFGELIPVEHSNPASEILREGKVRVRSAIVNLPREDRLPSYLFYMGDPPEDEPGKRVQPKVHRTHLMYPVTHLHEIRKEAVDAGGASKWREIGDTTVATRKEVTLSTGYPAKFETDLRMDDSCRFELALPGEQQPIHVTGYLKHISGIELDPAADGTRRILLLALDEVK